MRKRTPFLLLGGLALLSVLAYRLPAVQQRLSWRVDFALTYLRGMVQPAGEMPTTLPRPQVRITRQPTETPQPSPTLQTSVPLATPTSTPSPTPIPSAMQLASPKYEKQDVNACGPATLTMYLRYYGWDGDQAVISELIKPHREDRNVNVEEIAYYVRNRAGWLNLEYRVGGDIELLKRMIAAGIPVMIEESMKLDSTYWPNDDQWAAHYFLITGYDDATEKFTGQDSYYGPDRLVSYQDLDKAWQSFNRVYILIYPPEKEPVVQSILGPNWDPDTNRQLALEQAETDSRADPSNAYAWFNQGTNLVYFERYTEASNAYDTARNLGLPQRFLRYQFGPFIAYFHTGQTEDLLALTTYALQRTSNSEEALLWRGWANYREGKPGEAQADFLQALQENPGYQDAQYALDFLQGNSGQ